MPETWALLSAPEGLFMSQNHTIYFVDRGNNRIRSLYYSTVPTEVPSPAPSEMPTDAPINYDTRLMWSLTFVRIFL